VQVKICGITNLEDALAAVDAGADALGFVFYPKSPRRIEPQDAASIIRRIPPFIATVGVFVDAPADQIRLIQMRSGLSLIQFHGDEPPEEVALFERCAIKAIRVREQCDLERASLYRVRAILLDTQADGIPGGTGTSFDWRLAPGAAFRANLILAGGLTPENVRSAVQMVKPAAVDVASGVEAGPGKKDRHKVIEFIREAKAASRELRRPA